MEVLPHRHPVRLSLSEDLTASPGDPVAAVELFALQEEHYPPSVMMSTTNPKILKSFRSTGSASAAPRSCRTRAARCSGERTAPPATR